MPQPLFEFWFDFASTYSFPAAMRVEAVAAARNIQVTWRPFLLGAIFQQQGWQDSPFNLYPAKGAYMWRDLERLCAREQLAFHKPSVFPRNGLLASRIIYAHPRATWLADFCRGVFQANFQDDLDIAKPEVIGHILDNLDINGEQVMAQSLDPIVKEHLRTQTEYAKLLGIFGAPTFVSGQEIFWGNDQLLHALDWHLARLTHH